MKKFSGSHLLYVAHEGIEPHVKEVLKFSHNFHFNLRILNFFFYVREKKNPIVRKEITEKV